MLELVEVQSDDLGYGYLGPWIWVKKVLIYGVRQILDL